MAANNDSGADAATNGLSRRTFIELIGFSAAAAVASGCERMPEGKSIPYLKQPVELTPGKATWYASTCGGCSAGCGVLVKVRDGRPIKIEGNPDHSLSRGGLCAVGQASLASLYDGDRLREPLIDGKGTTWDRLDAEVNGRLAAYRTSGTVRLLTPTLVSPTARSIAANFLAQFGDARHVVVDPVSHSGMREAHRRAFGTPTIPSIDIDKAKLIVSIDADFLGTWLSPVQFARARADRRSPDSPDGLLRHIQYESRLSLTGGSSDRRVGLAPREVAGALLLLGRIILDRAGLGSLLPASDGGALRATLRNAIAQTADELWKHKGSSLLIVGVNDPELQEVAIAINNALGNYGSTLNHDAPSLHRDGDEREFDRLLDEMTSGLVGALVIWGANPVYNHPRGAEFAEAMKKVSTRIAISERNDETMAHMSVVAAAHHWLESWGDAEPVRGRVSLTQPSIAPLFKTRAPEETLLRWTGDGRKYYDVLRAEWKANRMPATTPSFEDYWERSLHDGQVAVSGAIATPTATPAAAGVQAETPAAAVTPTSMTPSPWNSTTLAAAAAKLSSPPPPAGLDLVLYEKVSLRDGTHGNNPLLHELPDPISRVSWTNYALLAPSTARRLGVDNGRIVKLMRGGITVELPARVLSGMPVDTVAVAVGYGRSAVGRVGNGIGANVWPLVARGGDGFMRLHTSGVTLTPTDRTVDLAVTQVHDSQEDRNLVRHVPPHEKAAPHTPEAEPGHEKHPSIYPGHNYTGHRWGMTVDVNACIGCGACVVGCQVENNIPVVGPDEMTRWREMHWIRIDRYIDGPEEDPSVDFQPIMCVHCENASCESVCPVIATAHSSEGLNMQAYNRCVGTRYCANNCAYKVRRFNWFTYEHNDPIAALALNPDVTVRTRGVMEKCSLCVQRIEAGKIEARNERRPIADGEIQPACAQSCPAQAITFGDMSDPKSRVVERKKSPRNYVLLEDLNLKPVVSYLGKV